MTEEEIKEAMSRLALVGFTESDVKAIQDICSSVTAEVLDACAGGLREAVEEDQEPPGDHTSDYIHGWQSGLRYASLYLMAHARTLRS